MINDFNGSSKKKKKIQKWMRKKKPGTVKFHFEEYP